jgi:mannose-1-phosphate guanylyltransferase
LVLAAGEGSRLRRLTTTTEGVAVPKQFCSLHGGPSLLHEAFVRAATVASRSRILSVVAEQHRRWWSGNLPIHPENVVVQPENRGTGIGILLPLLHIVGRDPDARVVLLPSDHYVRDEAVLARSLGLAVARLSAEARDIVLLGLEPDAADPELGYIVPGPRGRDGAQRVTRFVEKPTRDEAAALIAQGALWNVFIVAARAQALLELYAQRYPAIVRDLRIAAALDARDASRPEAVRNAYRSLPNVDFSRDVLEGAEASLCVLAAPPCGWSDLGTPERVAHTLRHAPTADAPAHGEGFTLAGCLSLARQHSLLHSATA